MTKKLILEVSENIRELDENIYFKYLLKDSYFNVTKNKLYSLKIEDIISEAKFAYPYKLKYLIDLEEYIKCYVEKDLKGKYNSDDYEYDLNYIYTSFPIYLNRKDKYPVLKLELVAIVEATVKKECLNQDKLTYIFSNDKECLEFVSSTTIMD